MMGQGEGGECEEGGMCVLPKLSQAQQGGRAFLFAPCRPRPCCLFLALALFALLNQGTLPVRRMRWDRTNDVALGGAIGP